MEALVVPNKLENIFLLLTTNASSRFPLNKVYGFRKYDDNDNVIDNKRR